MASLRGVLVRQFGLLQLVSANGTCVLHGVVISSATANAPEGLLILRVVLRWGVAVVAKATLLGTLSSGITMRSACNAFGLRQLVSANGTCLL